MLKVEFEGTDGAGKTTGLKYFIEKARERGLSVTETREVGNPNVPSCVKMREFVLDPKNNLRGETMEMIFSAMRFENDLWLQNLGNNNSVRPDLVVSDRGWFSHLAYTDHNVSVAFTESLYGGVMKNATLLPDVVIYFAVDTQTALQRRVKRGEGMADAIEMKGVGYQELVRGSFEKYLKATPGVKIYTVDANLDLDTVKAQLDQILNDISRPFFRDQAVNLA